MAKMMLKATLVATVLCLLHSGVYGRGPYGRKMQEELAKVRRSQPAEEPSHRRFLAATGTCADYGGVRRFALVSADPGTFTGSAEQQYFSANAVGLQFVPQGTTTCGSKAYGSIMGIPVILVTTGIGPLTAALCITELLKCREYIAALVSVGTAGFPTQLGGVLNGDSPDPNKSTKVTRYGDVCITPLAVNWECQQTDWTMQCASFPNVNAFPADDYDVTADFLYGQCIFTEAIQLSFGLARQVAAAANSQLAYKNQPVRSKAVLENEAIYFGNMTLGTGVDYDYKDPLAKITAYQYSSCAEIDGQFFFSGVPWEISSRNFTAITLNNAYGKAKYTQKNVVYANAEEGIGVAFAIQQYNKLASTTSPLPFTIVRGHSDWTHAPVYKVKDGTWRQIDQVRDFNTGYQYAIASYSNVVLTWLQRRCIQANGANCKFTISYS